MSDSAEQLCKRLRGAVMTKERTSNERFEIVGLTKAEVDRCMEVLCGGPMPWDRGYCFASSELFARPSRYGPEPSNVRTKSFTYRIVPSVTDSGEPIYQLYRDWAIAIPLAGLVGGSVLLAQNKGYCVLDTPTVRVYSFSMIGEVPCVT